MTNNTKILLCALALLLASPLCQAQKKEKVKVKTVEFEVGGGVALGTDGYDKSGAWMLDLALRCNLPHSGLDLGMYFAYGDTWKGYPYTTVTKMNGTKIVENYYEEIMTYMIPTIHYNWRRGKKISYFAGGGVGLMTSKDNHKEYGFREGCACIMPRAGVEFFNRLRLTVDYKLNTAAGDYTGIHLGFVFGGGKKKA